MKQYEIGFGADALLRPKAVAVIGVSGNSAKKNVTGGTAVLNNLVRFGYQGNIYPINPKYDTVAGLKSYPAIGAVPEKVDLVVVAVAADKVPDVLEECGQAGCRAAIIISSGFAEVSGPEGKALQEQIVEIGNRYSMRLIGPNNLGSYNVLEHMVASTSSTLLYYNDLPGGAIAWVSQSGALCSSIYGRAYDEEIGVPCVVTTGNECDLQSADIVWTLLDDPRIHVVCVYCEGIRDREKFAAAARKAQELGKPLLVFKNGKTLRGGQGCRAHTASDAGEIDDYRAFFDQIGAIMVDSLDEFYETANLLDLWRDYGDVQNFAVISTSGGSGICLTDCITGIGLEVPPLSQALKESVMAEIPSFGSAANPIDVTAHILRTPEKIAEVGKLLQASDEVDAIVLAPTTIAEEASLSTAQDFIEIIRSSKKPCMVHWYGGSANAEAVRLLRKNGIAAFTEYDAFARALLRRKQFFAIQSRAGQDG